MRGKILKYMRAGLFALLLILTVVAVYITIHNTLSTRDLALQSLKSTASSLSVSAESAFRLSAKANDDVRGIFSDRVVAYALVASPDGKVIFHTNPRLEGEKLPADEIARWPVSGTVSSRRLLLGTGTPAYEFNFILHASDRQQRLLRLVLHTEPTDLIIARADRMWWIVSSVLLLLWFVGIALERVFTRYLKIQGKLEKQERFTLIGQMTAVLAHEIRNALGGVKGFSQWLAEKMDDKDERKPAVVAVIKGTVRIETLVNDLLLFSREEVYNISSVILQPIAQEVLHSFSLSWKGKFEVDIDSNCRILADSVKLYRVLLNGVKNSIEAMGDGGLLKMSAALNRRKVIITISDSGKGVAENDMQLIFTPFFTTKINGTGLGLAYSRKVIEGMGGTIELCNKPDSLGAELNISLPGGKK